MQMDEEVGKLASATPVMICESSPYLPLLDPVHLSSISVNTNVHTQDRFANIVNSKIPGMFPPITRR